MAKPAVFDDAELSDWEALEDTYGLPDPDDEHVVAAAVVANRYDMSDAADLIRQAR